ncbi:MAG: hypothetical protein ACRCUB_08360 [Plesiomonas shigelloides]
MNLSSVDFKKLADVISRNKPNNISALCLNSWNGFVSGHRYDMHADDGEHAIYMIDKFGLMTFIRKDCGAEHFSIDPLPELEDLPSADPETKPEEVPIHVHLQRLQLAMMEKNTFAVGHLVTWKDGLSNRTVPAIGKPAIVTEVLSEPIFDSNGNSSSCYFREPLDIKLGALVASPDGETFSEFYADSRRLRHFDPDSDNQLAEPTADDDGKLRVPKFIAVRLNR